MRCKPVTLLIVPFALLFALGTAHAKMAPPRPPATNMHAPVTKADKARVALATDAIKRFWQSDLPKAFAKLSSKYVYSFQSKDARCIKSKACFSKDINFGAELKRLRSTYGKVVEYRHAHIIPWSWKKFMRNRKQGKSDKAARKRKSKMRMHQMVAPQLAPDEYMVHVYVRFSGVGGWHHMDVILSEDAKGKPSLRHFFATPMRSKMPPGVKC
jgi:hypothetical protein